MADSEVPALKEALCNQYIMMKKLYAELEEEREASASAASETLSMILRLQREKAAEKMESSQYKRMAEEKMHHAEERLEFLEEVIQENEMEITSLRYQVETYKQKLSRHGVNIPDVGQMMEDQYFPGNNVNMDKTSLHRRNISLPSLFQLDQCSSDRNAAYDESGTVETDSSVWNQAEELNNRLKGLMHTKNAKELSCSNVLSTELLRPLSLGSVISDQDIGSWYSAASAGTSFDSTTGGIRKKSDDHVISCLHSQVRDSESVSKSDGPSSSSLEAESIGNSAHPAGIHDVFEISESLRASNPNQQYKQLSEESAHEVNTPGVLGQMPQESGDYLFRDDDWLNKAFMGQSSNKVSPPKKPPNLPRGSKLSTPSKGTSYHRTLGDPKVEIGATEMDLEQLKLRLKQLQKERIVMHDDTERNKEQLVLLRNIFKQLNTIETHMQKPASKKYDVRNDSKVVSVMEAVLSFSI